MSVGTIRAGYHKTRMMQDEIDSSVVRALEALSLASDAVDSDDDRV